MSINRLEIVTKSLAQGMIPATEMNVFLVVSVQENYVWKQGFGFISAPTYISAFMNSQY